MSLDDALKRFAQAFASGSRNDGVFEHRNAQAVVAPIEIGPVLKEMYSHVRMGDDPQVGGRLLLSFFDVTDLERAQHGWRWVTDDRGVESENPDWMKNWIVFADRNGDALIVDDSDPEGKVYGNIGGDNFFIAEKLSSFFNLMADAMTAEANEFNYDTIDEDFTPYPKFIERMAELAVAHLGEDGKNGFMKFFFG